MSRLAKKFLRPDSVDGSKIKLSNDEALKAANAAGSGSVSFLKVNTSDVPEFLILPVLSADPTSETQVSRKGYVDSKAAQEAADALSSAQSYTDTAISNLVNGAPALLDTLKELADALGSDENFAVTIGNQISALDGRLDVIEGSDVTTGSVLWAKKQSYDYTDSKIAQEVIDRDSAISVAEQGLQDQIDQEILDREAAVENEADLRQAADDLLDGRLDILEGADSVEGSVAKAEKDAKDYADGLVDAEQQARESADSALDGRLDVLEGADNVAGSVAKALKDAKNYTDGEISQEVLDRDAAILVESQARESGDDALDARLDVIEGDSSTAGSVAKAYADAVSYTENAITALIGGAPALLDTLKEIADALGNDENFAATIAGQISGLDSRVDVIEGSNTTVGSVLWAKKQSYDYTDAEIAQEVLDRDAAILVESNARIAGDDALDGRLDILEGADTVAGSVAKALKDAKAYTDSEVSAEESARIAGDDALDARLDTLEGDASTVGSLAKAVADLTSYVDGEIADEVAAREAADENIQDQLDNHDSEITDLQAAVSSLNSGTFHKQKKVLGAGDVTAQYVDLAYEAKDKSTMVFISGGAGGYMHEGDDYTVSVVGGVTRITFAGDFATGGATALESSDILYVQFQYVP
jgi:hypothetical protein